ncbi:uncharacterized protein DSM5745_00542 [Aspergillus mulundensis]|uniref:Uncharacterized protein n=1 Tax=Aspergillus mulundensis TaxID=1810919 RepID=A0A3D8T3W2_9EURO|nr:hypothetical protein DSM5745_00542 [Aspergillus mulundensis]RDW93220.1 hypothetical protein DSM5745_00542 [Aspergillus mulundensis]
MSQYDRTPVIRGKLETPEARIKSPTSEKAFATPLPSRVSDLDPKSFHSKTSYPSNVPSQPKAFSNSRNHKLSPPPGPPHGPKTLPSHPRASNISLLSAPTRPRGSSNFKDSGWASTSLRRGPGLTGSHGTAPRSNHLPVPVAEPQRSRSGRHNSVPTTPSQAPRHSKYLTGLGTILPGGKLAPLDIEATTEKRLSQLEADKDRLFQQITEGQKLKRAGLRDWDRLDRESTICALRSELAEGYLQCITDTEGILGRALF